MRYFLYPLWCGFDTRSSAASGPTPGHGSRVHPARQTACGLCCSTCPRPTNSRELSDPARGRKLRCLERADSCHGTSEPGSAPWCPTEESSGAMKSSDCSSPSALNCLFAFDIELLLVWNCQDLMNFKLSGVQLLINRGIYYVTFLGLCHRIWLFQKTWIVEMKNK